MGTSSKEHRLTDLLTDHANAVRAFVERASAIDVNRWLRPRAEGKWTPAQETKHVMLVYQLFLRQLIDGTPVRLRGTRVSRAIWRLIGLRPILYLGRIPMSVDAPREVRPESVTSSSREMIPELEGIADSFASAFTHAWRHVPGSVMMHPLVGKMSLDQGMRFLCVHTRHHTAFLPQPSPSPAIHAS